MSPTLASHFEVTLDFMRIVFWGTYDVGKPRTRILLRGLKSTDNEVTECRADVWHGVSDKSQIRGFLRRVRLLMRWLGSYPGLLLRYLRLPRHDCVIIGYLGHLDVLVIWPLAKLGGTPVVWDAFLSLYSTVVEDRKLVGRSHLLAHFLFAWEWLACRAADVVVLDTKAQADYFAARYRIPTKKTASVFVGVDPDAFPRRRRTGSEGTANQLPFTVLFYGSFIPLHGIDTIVRAAQLARDLPIEWVIIGNGQEEERIRALLETDHPAWLKLVPWVPYTEQFVYEWMLRANVCLGIFGASEKASRVIPNKVFQIVFVGRPLITRESPAIRELLRPDMPGVALVPPAEPRALLEAVCRMAAPRENGHWTTPLHGEAAKRILPRSIGSDFLRLMRAARESRQGRPI